MKHWRPAVTAIDDDLLQDAITVPPVPRRPAFGRWGAHSGCPAAGIWHLGAVAAVRCAPVFRWGIPSSAAQPVPGHNGSRPTHRRGARALYPWQPGSPPDPFRPRGMAAFHRRWRIADHPGGYRFRLERHPTGRGACTVLWAIPQPMAGKAYRLTLNAQTMTLSQNEQGVWMIQKAL